MGLLLVLLLTTTNCVHTYYLGTVIFLLYVRKHRPPPINLLQTNATKAYWRITIHSSFIKHGNLNKQGYLVDVSSHRFCALWRHKYFNRGIQ